MDDWLESFEARAECLGITNLKKKIAWCKSVIGRAGRKILRNLQVGASWADAKQELKRFLGEEDSRAKAWKKLQHYNDDGKSLGEIASDVIDLAKEASGETYVINRLALEAFIGVLPWKYAAGIRKKGIETVEAALKEVKLLKNIEDEEQRRTHTVLQGHTRHTRRETRSRPERAQYKRKICWGCKEEGHLWKDCPEVQEWKKYKEGRNKGTQQLSQQSETEGN